MAYLYTGIFRPAAACDLSSLQLCSTGPHPSPPPLRQGREILFPFLLLLPAPAQIRSKSRRKMKEQECYSPSLAAAGEGWGGGRWAAGWCNDCPSECRSVTHAGIRDLHERLVENRTALRRPCPVLTTSRTLSLSYMPVFPRHLVFVHASKAITIVLLHEYRYLNPGLPLTRYHSR